MARIRTVKPEFWIDERVGECSPTARLLFIATWNFADDNGNLERSAKQIKAQAMPYDNLDCEPLLAELIDKELLAEYCVNGHKYLHISGFEKHQKIEKKSAPRCPLPDSSPTPPQPVAIVREGKVREWKGVEVAPEPTRIVFRIAQAYPFSTYRDEMDIPPIVAYSIVNCIEREGDGEKVLEYTKRYAASVDNPNKVMGMQKFFDDPQNYRREWRNGEQKQISKLDQLRALRKANGQDGGKLAEFDGGSTAGEPTGARVPEAL